MGKDKRKNNRTGGKKMRCEVIDVRELTDNWGKKKQVCFANGKTQNITEKNGAYEFVPLGFKGIAEIEWQKNQKSKTMFISSFKAVGSKDTQTTEKSHQQANKPFKSDFKYKCDPDKLSQGEWIRRHTSWIGCLQCAVNLNKDEADSVGIDKSIIDTTNAFYNALCEKVDGKKQVPNKSENDPSKINVNQPEVNAMADMVNQNKNMEKEAENIEDIPF